MVEAESMESQEKIQYVEEIPAMERDHTYMSAAPVSHVEWEQGEDDMVFYK